MNDNVFSPLGCSRLRLCSVRTRCSSGVLVRARAFRDSEPPCRVDMEAYWSWIKVTQEALIGWASAGLCLCVLSLPREPAGAIGAPVLFQLRCHEC